MAGITDDELKALTDSEMRNAVGYFGGRLANMRQKALIYYEGLPKGDLAPPEIAGRSSVVATEVRNVILSMVPGLMEKFASGDAIVECEAKKPNDEKAAETASEYLNCLFLKKCAGHKVLETAFMDALISKVGFIKCYWDTRTIETREEYRGLNDIELSDIINDDDVEPIEHSAYADDDDQEQRQQAMQQMAVQLQQAMQAAQAGNQQAEQAVAQIQQQMQELQSMPPKMRHDITVKRRQNGGKLAIENVPPEEVMISRRMKSLDIDKEPNYFIGHRILRTASELKSEGYKNVDDISSDDNGVMLSMERVERQTWDDDLAYLSPTDSPSIDPAQRNIWITEIFIKCDYDGDGVSELRRVVRAGDRILANEEVDYPPWVALRPIVMPHRFFGLSPADLAMEPQRIKTHVLRSILDNLHFQVNGRFFAVEGQVNLDDLLTSRPGGVVRVKNPQAVGRLEQGVSDSSGAMNMLQYMQGFTEEATGWNRTANASDNPDSLNLTATAANLASNKANQRTDMMARNLADGIVDLFRLMLKLVSQHHDVMENVKIGKEWMTLDPREWANMFDITLAVGLGTGSKDQQVQHLNLLMQHQGAQLQTGLGTVTPENIYQASAKLTNALGFKNAELFFTDPKMQPQQQKPDHEMLKIQAGVQADQQKAQMQAQLKAQELQLQDQFNERQAQREMQLEQWKQSMQAQQNQHQNTLEAQREQLQARNEAMLEQMRMTMEQRMAALDRATQLLITHANNTTKIDVAELGAMTTLQASQASAAAAAGGSDGNQAD